MSQLLKVSLKYNVEPRFLEFIGIQDESKTVGKIFYHFNIMDEKHARYGSTVVCMEHATK